MNEYYSCQLLEESLGAIKIWKQIHAKKESNTPGAIKMEIIVRQSPF